MSAVAPTHEPSPRSRRATAIATVTVALALALVAVGLRRTTPPASGLEGERIAPVSLAVLTMRPHPDVQRVALGAPTGKPTLVHFWGPSCAPCVEEAPAIDALAAEADGAGFEVLTISAEDAPDIRELMLGKGLQFRVLHDAAGAAHTAFRVAAIPHSFVLDAQGVVRREFVGPQPTATLREALLAAR
ncbi:MAG: hypothetical protein RIT45_242 [Pseudomonadota bacterium]|jgi:thiol-disulfide isomerase/thioredoxin